MKNEDRKAAIAAYKKRTPPVGIFSFKCSSTGDVWIGTSTDLDKIENRHRFTLKAGGHPHKRLQQVWNAHSEDAFRFEILSVLKEKETELTITRDRRLKELLAQWREKLGAEVL